MPAATRMTRQRSVILEELRKLSSHPTVDELYAIVRTRMPRISLGTVYRNLDVLAASREIRCLENAGTQKRFDGMARPHPHVRCTVCGKVGDVHGGVVVPSLVGVHADGFRIHAAQVEFEGVCARCDEAKSA